MYVIMAHFTPSCKAVHNIFYPIHLSFGRAQGTGAGFVSCLLTLLPCGNLLATLEQMASKIAKTCTYRVFKGKIMFVIQCLLVFVWFFPNIWADQPGWGLTSKCHWVSLRCVECKPMNSDLIRVWMFLNIVLYSMAVHQHSPRPAGVIPACHSLIKSHPFQSQCLLKAFDRLHSLSEH